SASSRRGAFIGPPLPLRALIRRRLTVSRAGADSCKSALSRVRRSRERDPSSVLDVLHRRLGHARDLRVLRDKRFFPDKERARELRERIAAIRTELRKGDRLSPEVRARLYLDLRRL